MLERSRDLPLGQGPQVRFVGCCDFFSSMAAAMLEMCG
jgi:hypothetical protein